MDSLGTIIVIFLAGILMFFFPLMAVSNTQDTIAQVAVQTIVADFVNKAATQGKITVDNYEDFLSDLSATSNSYDVQLEHKIMTTNPNKGANDQIGENLYYSVYNTTILNKLYDNENNQKYILKKGDYIICSVKNTNTTIATQVKNWLFAIAGKDVYVIAGSASALVVNNGN